MTPTQLDAALDDIARAAEMEFGSIEERNEHILAALNKHFPFAPPLTLGEQSLGQVRTVSLC
jgi:hypothetical protein